MPHRMILIRLGHRGSRTRLSLAQRDAVDRTMSEGFSLCRPQGCWARLAVIEHREESVVLEDCTEVESASLTRLLRHSAAAAIMAATVGPDIVRAASDAVFDAVLQGDEDGIGPAIEKALAEGVAPRSLVDDRLIAAINLVGEKFDKKECFLSQLISCADAMRRGFEVLEPHLAALEDGGGAQGPKVLLATVQGDIHDIGKNIVALMLKNYSFEVIDLGKDVSAETIIRAVKQYQASIVGLSALMTTTMVEMKRVIDLARAEGLGHVRFMIGGAVVDQHYADEIGVQGYAADALAAVRLAQGFGARSDGDDDAFKWKRREPNDSLERDPEQRHSQNGKITALNDFENELLCGLVPWGGVA